jgi:hypothetical protein
VDEGATALPFLVLSRARPGSGIQALIERVYKTFGSIARVNMEVDS